MKYEKMKQAAEGIKMPEDMKRRILYSCRTQLLNTEREYEMKKHKIFKKPAAVLATLILCLSMSATAVAERDIWQGFFQDITDFRGAITGQTYEQATAEIDVHAAVTEDALEVQAVFVDPERMPYSELEHLGIGAYQIIDDEDHIVREGAVDAFAPVTDGQAKIELPMEALKHGRYRLIITAFTGEKKADQDLMMYGHWEYAFTVAN